VVSPSGLAPAISAVPPAQICSAWAALTYSLSILTILSASASGADTSAGLTRLPAYPAPRPGLNSPKDVPRLARVLCRRALASAMS
jgi:hypothetical protein